MPDLLGLALTDDYFALGQLVVNPANKVRCFVVEKSSVLGKIHVNRKLGILFVLFEILVADMAALFDKISV